MYESSTGLSVPNAPVTRSAPRPALATAAAVPEEDERSIYPGGGIVPWFEEEELSYEGGGLYDYPTKSTIITAAAKATAVDSAKVKSRSSASLESEPETETELEMSLEADESGLPSPLVPVVPPEPGTATLEPGMIAELTEDALEVLRGHAAVSETRPPYSYTALIYMAMHAIAKERIQLGEIYNQVTKSWAYYLARPAETGWKNSIRHNLTVSRCFKKVARAEGEAGKGGYWMIDEALARVDILLSPRQNVPRVSKKARMKKTKLGVAADPSTIGGGMVAGGGAPRRPTADGASNTRSAVARSTSCPGAMAGKRTSRTGRGFGLVPVAEKVPEAEIVSFASTSGVTATSPFEHLHDGMFIVDEPSVASQLAAAPKRGSHEPGHSTRVVLGDEPSFGVPSPSGLGLSDSFSASSGLLGSSLNMGSAALGQSFSAVLARGCLVDA